MKKALERLGSLLLFVLGMNHKEKAAAGYRPLVTVMIPAYNEEAVIANTIASVQAQTYPVSRVVVVDDCSTDRTGEIAKGLGVEVIRTPANTGTKSKAQNYALESVETDVVVTVDADTVLDQRAIELVIPELADGKTLSVCGFVIPQMIRTFWERARLVQYLYYIGLNKSAQTHWRIPLVSSGCFSAFSTKMLKEMGGFPEGTIVEDMALTWRGHIEHKRTKFVPRAVCYPKDPSNWTQYKAQVMRWNRGFLQCVKMYGLGLAKNVRLALFVGWYLLSGIINPFLWIFFAWYLAWIFKAGPAQPQLLFFLPFFGLITEMMIVFIVVFTMGIRYNRLGLALISLPHYWLTAPVDSFLFLNALIQEWVLGRRLQLWEKGH